MLVSLYDESGNAVRDSARLGEECHCFDLLNDDRVEQVGLGTIHFHRANLLNPEVIEFIISLRPRRIIGFPPCTDLAACGAKHFAKKRLADPDFQRKAMQLVLLVPMLGDILDVPWMFENPRGSVSTLWRRPDFIFDPSEYGGWLPEDDVHPRFPNHIPPRDAYPKETWIWHGNGHVEPERRPVPAMDHYPGWAKVGGKGELTKRIRSETPRGFARAENEANSTSKSRGEIAIFTYMPHANHAVSAMVLGRHQLRVQPAHARQVLAAIRHGGGWRRHPLVIMWRGHEDALRLYHDVMVREWRRRGHLTDELELLPPHTEVTVPSWLGDESLHASHRALLLLRHPETYASRNWAEEPSASVVWPGPG